MFLIKIKLQDLKTNIHSRKYIMVEDYIICFELTSNDSRTIVVLISLMIKYKLQQSTEEIITSNQIYFFFF